MNNAIEPHGARIPFYDELSKEGVQYFMALTWVKKPREESFIICESIYNFHTREVRNEMKK